MSYSAVGQDQIERLEKRVELIEKWIKVVHEEIENELNVRIATEFIPGLLGVNKTDA